MATPALIVVITIALGTLLALASVTWVLVRRVKELTARLSAVQERLDPELDTLNRAGAVTSQQLEALSDRAARGRRTDPVLGDPRPLHWDGTTDPDRS